MPEQRHAAAVLTIHDAAKMTPKQRKGIGHWLDKMIEHFMDGATVYPKQFRDAFWTDSETKAAILTIRDAETMTAKGRKNIARWLDRQKQFFLDYPQELSARFTARYIVGAGPKGDVIVTDEPPRRPKKAA